MEMEVVVNERVEQRKVVSVEQCKRGGPPILHPYLRQGERAVHTVNGTVYIINVGYSPMREAKYQPVDIKPWDKLP